MNIFVWPFKLTWRLINFIFNITGRLVGVTLGLALMIIGLILTALVISAVVGIPLLILGLLLTVKSLF